MSTNGSGRYATAEGVATATADAGPPSAFSPLPSPPSTVTTFAAAANAVTAAAAFKASTSSVMAGGASRRNAAVPFNLIVVGHSHIGKSSFLRTLVAAIVAASSSAQAARNDLVGDSASAPASAASSPSAALSSLGRTSGKGRAGPSRSSNRVKVSWESPGPSTNTGTGESAASSVAASPSFFPPAASVTVPTPTAARIEFMEEQTGRRISLRLIDSAGLVLPPNIHLYSRLQPTLPPAVALNNDRELESIAQRWTDPIAAAIDAQYEATLQEESKVRRNPKSPDYLHHACLYFIDGHTVLASRGLTPLDRYALKRLADKLNVLLCIGKADMLTRRQLIAVRKYVTSDLRTAGILPNIYGFEVDLLGAEADLPVPAKMGKLSIVQEGKNWRGNPEDEEEDDELYDRAANEELQRIMPFAIVNDEGLDPATEPDSAVDVFGLPARRDVAPGAPLGRFFPWGTVEVGNPEHCDVISLMTTLFSTHFDELRVRTRETFYERWRTSRLLTVRESIRQSSTSQGLGMNLESSVKTRRESGLQRLVRAG